MPISRTKACFLCREAKARCDRAIPECSRCAERKLRCVYDGRNGFRGAGSSYPYPSRVALQSLMPQETTDPLALPRDQRQQDDSLARLLSSSAKTQQPLRVAELAHDDAWTADGLLARDPSVDPLLELDFAGDSFALGNIQSHIFAEKETISPGLMEPWGVSADMPEDSNVYSHGTWTVQELMKSSSATAQKDLAALTSTITTTTTAAADKNGSSCRPLLMKPLFRSCTMNSILLGQVTSYPKMMIEGDQLPPFIHAPCHIDNDLAPGCGERSRHQCLPQELAICASLVQMFYERTKANTDFVWTLIYEEQARLQREYLKFSSTQQLAAIQSAMVLFLLQASDPSTVETHNSEDLLNTVVMRKLIISLPLLVRSASLNIWRERTNGQLTHETPSQIGANGCLGRAYGGAYCVLASAVTQMATFVDVALVLAVMHIVARLLDGFVRGGCTPAPGSSFRSIPLPSSRDLWEARTSRVWTRDYKKNIAARTSDKVLTVGDVLESGGVSRSCSGKGPTTPELLPEVMRRAGGLDTLGMLVWMVIPFEDTREVHEHDAVICWS
ncbi:unnamed protein product [Clonostachys solani]|uniref:Zn(2)-C6 fungal-type domain-containing protein n=1 Tax=Clonostachys solani TaxID=160281 RepID=A0A9N9ZE02_9HYPO|nr:unnamed protein product [Clonostachys solani]